MLLARVHKPGRPHKVAEDSFTTLETFGILEVGALEAWIASGSLVAGAAGDDKNTRHSSNPLPETL
jgi:hypothetical protein